ncbi:MAG: hypothetical protein NC324_03625 [Bacteroides sp.]|nr:hypothetical protein [Bacteroides sp.]
MTFDDITEDGRLWAVRYDGDEDNVLYSLFDQWNDVVWLRNFFKANSYIITGGAIKLTATMQEREHTAVELIKIEKVRNFLLDEKIIDNDSFIEHIAEL